MRTVVQKSIIFEIFIYFRCLSKSEDESRLDELKRMIEPVKLFVDIQVDFLK